MERLESEDPIRVELVLQEWSDEKQDWGRSRHLFQKLRYPNDPDGRYRFEPIPPGRYRVLDAQSGVTSDGAFVDPGAGEQVVFLDLLSSRMVHGKILAPPGTDFALVRVLVEGRASPGRGTPRIAGRPESPRGIAPGMGSSGSPSQGTVP